MTIHLAKEVELGRLLLVKRLVTLSMTLAFLSELVSFVSLGGFLSALLMVVIWSAFYALVYRALKKLLYSFLTFVLIGLLAHALLSIMGVMNNQLATAALSGANVILSMIILYYVNRPIFFPKINWTEYDFRHRKDKRVNVIIDDNTIEVARLYDLRRGEAAVICITDLVIGNRYNIEDVTGEQLGSALVLSQRKTLLGRPATHGVKMVLDEV